MIKKILINISCYIFIIIMSSMIFMITYFYVKNTYENFETEMEIFKNLYGYPGSPADVQCGGKVTMESFLIPPLDGLQDPDIDFSINIIYLNFSKVTDNWIKRAKYFCIPINIHI